MSGLKLMAAALCGSALTLAVSTWAQAPKLRGISECGDLAVRIDVLDASVRQQSAQEDRDLSQVNSMLVDMTTVLKNMDRNIQMIWVTQH